MDAEGRIIPIVEDDQGEGFKDILDTFPILAKLEERVGKLTQAETDKSVNERLMEIQDKLDCLHTFLMRVFGNYVLIDGRFVDISLEVFKK